MDYYYSATTTLDSFPGSFVCGSTSRSDDVLESAGGWDYFERSSDYSSDLMNHPEALISRVNPEHIYQQCAALMECRRDHQALEFAAMANSRSNAHSHHADEVVGLLRRRPSSRSHSEERFFSNPDCTTKQATAAAAAHLPSVGADEAAIMRAMMAVISSSNSSSSAGSSPSAVSNNPLTKREAPTPPTTYRAAAASSSSPSQAFRPYSSTTAPSLELIRETSTTGQKMIKESVEMLRRMRSQRGEEGSSRSTNNNNDNNNNQLYHVISERKRREKLNDSFHRLRMILPPGSKKDKASVLNSARNQLRALRAQIAELEEKNRRLETHLLLLPESASDGAAAGERGEEGSVQVRVTKPAAAAAAAASAGGGGVGGAALQQIQITVTVRVECDIVELLLRVLERLKGRLRVVGVASVDAFTYSPQMPAFARADLNLQIRSWEGEEEVVILQREVSRAVEDVTATSQSVYFGGQGSAFDW